MFPEQTHFHEEQRLLRDRLVNGSRKGIRDIVKYFYAGNTVEYILLC